jgi:hypothetical protein
MGTLPQLPVVVALLFASLAPGYQRGVVQGVTVKPNPVAAGASAAVTATGTNPCGAVFVDWGDGTAITYAIYSLPATQTHAYASGGRFKVIAKGMGNCDGEVATTLDVKGPPPAPPPAPPAPKPSAEITNVEMTPSPAVIRQPVEITVSGRGACAFSVDFGDGNTDDESGELPRTIRHTYALARTYVLIVRPQPPCAGKFTQKLAVEATAPAPELAGVSVVPVRGVAGQPVTIHVNGAGVCRYAIDYGDGNRDLRSHALPDRVPHNYPAPDRYTISASAEPPCVGSARTTLIVRPPYH